MPAIKKIAHTEVFARLNLTSQLKGETNDCSVKAVAVVAGVVYDEAHRALAARGRKLRKGAWTHDILAVVRLFGKEVARRDAREFICQYPSPHRDVLKSVTTHHPRRFNKAWPKGKFLLFSKGHVSAVVDGQLHDWAVNKAKRVIAIYEVK
jgi:hypothetical protein